MGSKIAVSVAACVWVLCVSAGATAGTWTDNFNDGNADGWTVLADPASTWTVQDGGYRGEIGGGAEGIAYVGEDDWQVESIEVKVRSLNADYAVIIWRFKDKDNFDAWWLYAPGKTLEAWPKVGVYEGAARTTVAVPFDAAKEATVKVVLKGNTFDAYFDGALVGSYDNDALSGGKVGLLVWNGNAVFDDVVITGPNIGNVTAVSPGGKLATTWASVKTR